MHFTNSVTMKKTSDKETLLRGLATVNFYAADVKAAKNIFLALKKQATKET